MDPNVLKLRQRSVIAGSHVLRSIYLEAYTMAQLVTKWTRVAENTPQEKASTGGGFAMCLYQPPDGGGKTYAAETRWSDIGNLVHEMTHIACNEAFGKDFLNYPNTTNNNVPARVFGPNGNALNEADRQTRQINWDENAKIQATLKRLQTLCMVPERKGGLSGDNATKIFTKLQYGYQWPFFEFHTTINHAFVWLTDMGYPSIGHKKGKMPAANTFYYELEKVALKNWWLRTQGLGGLLPG